MQAMAILNRPVPKRKPSKFNMLNERLLAPEDIHPSTSESSQSPTLSNRRHTGLGKMSKKFRQLAEMTRFLSSSSAPPSTPPSSRLIIPKLAKPFVDALNATQLSNFLTWMLYYKTVELTKEPEAWYKPINDMEMRGWVSLGSFLSKSLDTTTKCGSDLIVLDSICDGIELPRSTVHEFLIKFADPDSMRYSMIATTTQKAHLEGCTLLEVLEVVQTKLHELNTLASNLHPQSGSQYDEWHAVI